MSVPLLISLYYLLVIFHHSPKNHSGNHHISKNKFQHFNKCLSTKILFKKIYKIKFQIEMASYILVSYSSLIFLGRILWLSCSKYCSARWETASCKLQNFIQFHGFFQHFDNIKLNLVHCFQVIFDISFKFLPVFHIVWYIHF